MTETNRASWGSKLGVMLAAAGSAVGLGNIWRFPFCTAQNGGGTFLMIYIVCSFVIGMMLVFAESALGIKAQSDPTGAFGKINPRLKFIGGLCILTSVTILAYYNVVGGWILYYMVNVFSISTGTDFAKEFSDFSSSPVQPLIYFYVYLLVSAGIMYFGIKNGIEKFSKVMMPLLLILLVTLMGRVLMFDKAWEGIKFFFTPDFSKMNGATLLDGMGHVFFSVSAGMGVFNPYL